MNDVRGFEPAVLLDWILGATERLLATCARFDDADVREPSLLPGWTRGHVLTHLARNAEGGCRLLAWARTGTQTPEYPSMAARAEQIEAGAGRGADELTTDVRDSADRFAAEYRRMPYRAWQHMIRWTGGQEHPAARAADARLSEVLIHHVDLCAGYTPEQWPADFVEDELHKTVASFSRRGDVPPMRLHVTDGDARYEVGTTRDSPVIQGPRAWLLAWLMGRSEGAGLTTRDGAPLPVPPFLY